MAKRPNILTIAGFDPTAGAGLLADLKTFEKNKCLGFAIQTANTAQTEDSFEWLYWTDKSKLKSQLDILLKDYSFDVVKIGIVESLEVLNEIIDALKQRGDVKIIWDPVLKSSSGFDFRMELDGLSDTLKKVYLITPNWNEIKILGDKEDAIEAATFLSKYTTVYLKGGHADELGVDYLVVNSRVNRFLPKGRGMFDKHGSGCVFSSALAANIARGYSLQKGILRSKRYVEQFLSSNKSLLGYHV